MARICLEVGNPHLSGQTLGPSGQAQGETQPFRRTYAQHVGTRADFNLRDRHPAYKDETTPLVISDGRAGRFNPTSGPPLIANSSYNNGPLRADLQRESGCKESALQCSAQAACSGGGRMQAWLKSSHPTPKHNAMFFGGHRCATTGPQIDLRQTNFMATTPTRVGLSRSEK
jgi:hypothetical protein